MKTVAGGSRTVLHVISSCLRTYLFVSTALAASLSAATPDYVAEIKPLLKNQCVKCHGASTQKGGLRLDTAAGALKGGEHGAAVVPGSRYLLQGEFKP